MPRLRILLVEDNSTNRLIASQIIEHMGHQVDAVADGREALQAVRSTLYDLILMDVMIPEMDGLAATKLIRNEPGIIGRVPIVGLTANTDCGQRTACRNAGMDGCVSKPVTAERLASAIEDAVRGNGAWLSRADWPVLDEAVLLRLAGDIGEDGALQVVTLFLAEAPRMIDRLGQSCISPGRALLREVHTLASAARSVGLLRVGHAAADIEHTLGCEEPDAAQLATLLELLRHGVIRLAEWEGEQQARRLT